MTCRIPVLRNLSLLSFLCLFLLADCSKKGATAPEKQWQMTIVAGSGDQGFADGAAYKASFHYPCYITIDAANDLYVSDVLNFAIRKISHDYVTTYAGRSIKDQDPLYGNIYGIAIDKQNNIYDIEYNLIRKLTSGTTSNVFAGSLTIDFKDGQDTAARFF